MKRILGIDLGTNSLGWAVMGIPADKKEPIRLLDKGVVLFDEGVIVEKGNEKSKAAERTKYRSARRLKFRRKLRKYKTLRVLARNGMVPLDTDEVDAWRRSNFKKYPSNPEFLEWLRTDENLQKNPYRLRAKALNEKLTPYELGRVFYHLAQRRGFLSNRLERNKKDDETGKVKSAISELTKAMEAAGARTAGEYFWMLYQQDRTNAENKIRTRYLGRKEHYLQEFEAICKAQALDENLCKKLRNAIFYQRPLKSQKGLVGKCVFEPKKPRIPLSHPLFEEFRMWSFINNIKIKTPEDEDLRFLSNEEKEKIIPIFEKAPSRKTIKFKDIADKLIPTSYKKAKMAYHKSREATGAHFLFNYPLDHSVATSPVRAFFKKYLGEDWASKVFRYTVTKPDGSQVEKSANWEDIWHILFTFEDEDKIKEYVTEKLGLNEETANKFAEFALPEGYASLSHKAINKILPFLKQGYTYDKAVLLAKVPDILGAMWEDDGIKQEVFDFVNRAFDRQTYEQRLKRAVNRTLYEIHKKRISDRNSREQILTGHLESIFGYRTKKQLDESHDLSREALQLLLERLAVSKNIDEQIIKQETIEQQLKDFLEKLYKEYELKDTNEKEKQDKTKFDKKLKELYHPSMTDIYRRPPVERDGKKFLGSPIVDSIKNPVMMRSMHILRKLVNTLIAKEKIDEETVVHLELARDLHDANMRKAIKVYQNEREKENKKFEEAIKEIFNKNGILREPTKDDIRRYRLREEQNGVDVYTGKSIADHELFDGTKYDIEHTVPRSLSYDNSLANLTVTSSKFNREVKRNKLPSELDNHDEIKARLDYWYKKREKYDKEIQALNRKIRLATTKEAKDNLIVKRHVARMHKDYWDRKIKLFELEEVPEDFKVSQLNDTRILTRYARAYLKTIFPKVHVVNGNMTATFRELWGLQEQGEKKDRSNHIHHAIDAAVIAAITRNMYNRLAEALHKDEEGLKAEARDMIAGMKPWETFTEDMKNLHRETVVYHDFRDILPKHSKKKVRKRGVIQYTYVTELPNWFRYLIEQGVYREGINYWREIKDGKERFKIPVFAQGDTARGVLHKETFYGAIARKDEKGNIVKDKKGDIQVDYVVRKRIDELKTDKDFEKIVDPVIREIVTRDKKREKEIDKEIKRINEALRNTTEKNEIRLKAELEQWKAEKQKLYRLPTKKGGFVPIKKVRIYAKVKNPIEDFKKHRNLSSKPYKQGYHVDNKENYGLAIYEGVDDKGRLQRDFEIISNLRAAEYFKRSNAAKRQSENRKYENLIPLNKNGLPLKYILKKGMTVMFYRESPEELKELSREELVKRIYVITQLRKDGNIYFIPTTLGGKMNDLKPEANSKLEFSPDRMFLLSKKNWNFLLNELEFDIDIDGEIRFRF